MNISGPICAVGALCIELWDQARHDLACLTERERLQFDARMARLARAASVRRAHHPHHPDEEPQLARLCFGFYEIRLKFDWARGRVEVLSISPQDED